MKKYSSVQFVIPVFVLLISAGSCLGDCAWNPIKLDTLQNGEVIVKMYRDSLVISVDTVSPDRFLSNLVLKYRLSEKCFVGRIDTVIHYSNWQDPWWVNSDSIRLSVGIEVKGGLLPLFWLTDADSFFKCNYARDMCVMLTADWYKSYATVQNIKYLFFFESNLVFLRNSSVNPNWCTGDRGNRIDDSNFIWSDYPTYTPNIYPQVKVSLQSFLSAIQTSVIRPAPGSQKSGSKVVSKITPVAEYYDIRGKRINGMAASRKASGVVFSRNTHSNTVQRVIQIR